MAVGGVPPMPPEVLEEEREKIRKQLELERGKSRVLYERAYQDYLQGLTGQKGPAKGSRERASESDFVATIRKAYADAFALRAFRDVMEDVTGHGALPGPESAPSLDNVTASLMKSGLPPAIVNQWLKGLDPEALGALIALSSQNQNPALSAMAFAMTQRQGGKEPLTVKDVIELNTAIGKSQQGPNVNIDLPKLIEAVKQQPPTASSADIVNSTIEAIKTGISLANQNAPRSEGEPRPKGILETLLSTNEGIKTAHELGMIGGETNTLNIIAEMRKNDQLAREREKEQDRKWDLRLTQLQAENRLKYLQIKEGRRRTDLIAGALQKVGKAFADGITEGHGAEGKEAGQESEGSGLQQYTCEQCKSIITVPPGIQPGGTVECAKCHAKYEVVPPTKAAEQAAITKDEQK